MKKARAQPAADPVQAWFARQGWEPAAFQKQAGAAYAAGRSGLIHAPTGAGKTLAAWLGPVAEALAAGEKDPPLRVVWLTPLRALAADTAQALQQALAGLGAPWRVGSRTGDTTAKERAALKLRLPFALVTTPESLCLLLSQEDARERFAGLRCVVVDEWHELLGTKRGVQAELALARLRTFSPGLRTWGLSATIGNLDEACRVLTGPPAENQEPGVLIHAAVKKVIEIETLLPAEVEQFPWFGHLGATMLGEVVKRIETARTTLLFTNTRSQTEIWFQELLEARPDWAEQLAMHHGSLEKDVRTEVEERLRQGTVKCVVCTSSLDLGVDFSPVEQVLQLGSPKGIARLLQRAGRSGHQPGSVSRVLGVPTNAFELVEFAAARVSMREGRIESRRPLVLPLDVLLQHLVTAALGGGFFSAAMLAEVRSTHAYAGLGEAEWAWLLGFITTGGSLRAYPEYRKVEVDSAGCHRVTDVRLARLHRMSIGTILSDAAVSIRMVNGKRLGTVEEWFISRIKVGGMFIFGGRRLELVRFKDLTATVKPATRKNARGQIPSWQGGKSPLSTELAAAVGRQLVAAQAGETREPELAWVAPILEIQAAWSVVPGPGQLLIEQTETKDGHHAFVFPFAGRLVNEGIGLLVAWRMARGEARSIQVTPNDYGFELHSPAPLEFTADEWRVLLSPEGLLEDLPGCLNTAELGRHQFREVARVAGLVLQGYPGSPKTAKSLQASSGLLYDVFTKYDPDNLLLAQARREILERQLDVVRLEETLRGLAGREIILKHCPRLTPMAFPLWADSISSNLSTEDFATRLERMLTQLNAAADARDGR